jgi:hypothetical protein
MDPDALPDAKFQMGRIFDVVPGVLAFACCKDKKQLQGAMKHNSTARFFTSDYHGEYTSIGGDFGPLDLGKVHLFCKELEKLMNDQ